MRRDLMQLVIDRHRVQHIGGGERVETQPVEIDVIVGEHMGNVFAVVRYLVAARIFEHRLESPQHLLAIELLRKLQRIMP